MSNPVPPPSDEAIRSFLLGKLPPEQAAGVAEWLAANPSAASRFGGLAEEDPLLNALGGNHDSPRAAEGGPGPDPIDLDGRGALIGGRYRLLEQIGEGGMGTVWRAQQTEPVKRLVALKLIRPGMDTKQVLARFEAERQALALMDHPNIAKVLDAGTAADGHPYFAMELVKGTPITTYCDGKRLPIRDRIALFADVCRAVQHAHLKGVIHRDIKPSNVLVEPCDGRAVVKVIDFGVAKAAGPGLTAATLVTGFGAVVGTPEYMSPEQAEAGTQDVDTRSDVYSLGVLLYELLTGTTPLTRRRAREAALLEVLRVVREEEPTAPSTRLSASAELPAIAAVRGAEPGRLPRLVRGELDWIVMKALEKDRDRRYETANGFAADLDRYLADEPVLAGPPTAGYRLRKFARRNRGGLAAAALALVFVALLCGGAGWAVREREARAEEAARRRAERQARAAGQVDVILAEGDRLGKDQRWPEALAAARRALAVVEVGEAAPETLDRVRRAAADAEAVVRLEEIRLDMGEIREGGRGRDHTSLARCYAAAFREMGVDVETLPVDEAAARLRSRPAVIEPVVSALDEWGPRLRKAGDDKTARERWDLAALIDPDPWRVRVRRAIVADDMPALLALARDAGANRQAPRPLLLLTSQLKGDNTPHAVALLERAAQDHPADFWTHAQLGLCYSLSGQSEAAVREYTAARALRPQSVAIRINLGSVLHGQERMVEAAACFRSAVDLDPNSAVAHSFLGIALLGQKKLDEAVACCRRAVGLDPKAAIAHRDLGLVLEARGKDKWDEAESCYRRAIDLDPQCLYAYTNLGRLLEARGKDKWDEAESWHRKAILLHQDFASGHNDLGALLFSQDKKDEAAACFRKAIDLAPRRANYPYNLGVVLEAQGKRDEAIACYRKAADLGHKDAHSALAWLVATHPDAKICDHCEALQSARRAVESLPDEGLNWGALGAAHYRTGDFKSAVTALEKAMKLGRGGDSREWFFLAMAHSRLGDESEAQELYDQAVDWMKKNAPKNEELNRLRAEAQTVLGRPK